MNARFSLLALVFALVLSRCGCEEKIQQVKPALGVSPSALDFGRVKVGDVAERTITLSAQSQAVVSIASATLHDGTAPGGASAFELVGVPQTVGAVSNATFSVRFRPSALQAYGARLALASNDPQRPTLDVLLAGEGAHPILQVIVECLPEKECKGTAVSDPPSIDFGEEPLDRAVPIPVLELPTVTLLNVGEVTLALTRIALEGAQASAFSIEADSALKDKLPNGQPALFLSPRNGVSLPIRFKPFAGATAFSAELVVQSDDPTHAEVRVALRGTLGANQPPRICANITSVQNPDVVLARYDSPDDWAPLLTPPATGYDFSATRDIQPRATVTLSALSNPSDVSSCTSDPEDQREGLAYAWSVTKFPDGITTAPPLGGASTPTATLKPVATGEYELLLLVRDRQGHSSSTTITFVAVLKKDLVVQLSWGGEPAASANIDLDLHLVRPSSAIDPADDFSGVFSFFNEGANGNTPGDTSGDLNGFSDKYRRDNPGKLLNFDWGSSGLADDPTLNVDDVGSGPLVETISLNYPEDDEACAAAPCTYKVLVHYFEDKRPDPSGAPPCTIVQGCFDGDRCNCSPDRRCVAVAAPTGVSPSGTGRCFVPPKPVVRVFLKANPSPAAVIPLATEELFLGAPCQTLYVADVVWPARGAASEPRVIARSPNAASSVRSRFGVRNAPSLACTGNSPISTPEWYDMEPL